MCSAEKQDVTKKTIECYLFFSRTTQERWAGAIWMQMGVECGLSDEESLGGRVEEIMNGCRDAEMKWEARVGGQCPEVGNFLNSLKFIFVFSLPNWHNIWLPCVGLVISSGGPGWMGWWMNEEWVARGNWMGGFLVWGIEAI